MNLPGLLRRLTLAFALLGAPAALAQGSGAPQPREPARATLSLELNKLESATNLCRAYFLVENRLAEVVQELRLDTFIFDKAGVIVRRVGLTFPDLRPGRLKVVPFDFAGTSCGDLGKLLVNDVLACLGPGGAPVPNCGDLLTVSTRASAEFAF